MSGEALAAGTCVCVHEAGWAFLPVENRCRAGIPNRRWRKKKLRCRTAMEISESEAINPWRYRFGAVQMP